MQLIHGLTTVTVAAALLTCLPGEAHARLHHPHATVLHAHVHRPHAAPGQVHRPHTAVLHASARGPRTVALHARVAASPAGRGTPFARPAPFGAECRIAVRGSQAVAHCHNPYVDTDRVRLHIECAHWWDLDTDGAPADTGPAETVRLAGRCWKEIRAVWVSHQNRGS